MEVIIKLSADEAESAIESGSMLDLIKVVKHEFAPDRTHQITIDEIVQNGQETPEPETKEELKPEEEKKPVKKTTRKKAAKTKEHEETEKPEETPADAVKPKHTKDEIRAIAGPMIKAGKGRELRPILDRFDTPSVSDAKDGILDDLYGAVKELAEQEGFTDAVTA